MISRLRLRDYRGYVRHDLAFLKLDNKKFCLEWQQFCDVFYANQYQPLFI